MQAYQSAPCPYCGATWNPPGAQTCTNCRNQLPPPPPAYAPPGYDPQPGQPPQTPAPGQSFPYYQQAPGYPQPYPGQQQPGQPYAPQGQPAYPVQQGQPQYPGYPAGYGQPGAYPGAPYGAPGYPGMSPAGAPPGQSSTTLRLFGQSFTVPLALPPIVVQYQQRIAYAVIGLVALFVLFLGVLPAVASSQISAANQSLTGAAAHQAKVDAGFATFFAPDSTSSDLNVLKAGQTKTSDSISASLAIVRADESALSGADQRLGILSFVAPPSGSAIRHERALIQATLNGLKQADTALTAGSNMGSVLLSMYDLKIDYARMSIALNKHDLVGAAAPYPDAQQKLQQAQAAAQAPGVPAVLRQEVAALASLLDNTESLIQAIQNKDAAGVKNYSAAVQAGLKTIAGLSLPADYEIKTYGPDQKAYDAAIKSLKP